MTEYEMLMEAEKAVNEIAERIAPIEDSLVEIDVVRKKVLYSGYKNRGERLFIEVAKNAVKKECKEGESAIDGTKIWFYKAFDENGFEHTHILDHEPEWAADFK